MTLFGPDVHKGNVAKVWGFPSWMKIIVTIWWFVCLFAITIYHGTFMKSFCLKLTWWRSSLFDRLFICLMRMIMLRIRTMTMMMMIREAIREKIRDYLRIFPKRQNHPPFWEPLVKKKLGEFVKILACFWVILVWFRNIYLFFCFWEFGRPPPPWWETFPNFPLRTSQKTSVFIHEADPEPRWLSSNAPVRPQQSQWQRWKQWGKQWFKQWWKP